MTDTSPRDQTFIRKLTDIIQANIENEAFGVKELARASGVSLYVLGRRVHLINRKTVNQFIREVRLQKALEMLRNEDYSVSEVAYRTGFGSPAYFNKCFHEHFGYSPGKIKKGIDGAPEPDILTGSNGNSEPEKTARQPRMLAYAGTLFLILAIVSVGYFIYTKIQKTGQNNVSASPDGRISIAVMPFQNMTNDSLWDIWQNGIQINLITSLSNSEELSVRQTETVNSLLKAEGYTSYMSITPSVGSSISKKLDAAFFISGNISKAGNTLRLNAMLTDAKSKETHRSFQIDGTPELILLTADSLSTLIHNSLLIFKLGEERPDLLTKQHYFPTESPEAYRYFILGQTAFFKNDFPTAIDYFEQALNIDTSMVSAMEGISSANYNLSNYGLGKEWCIRSRALYDQMSLQDKIRNDALFAVYFRTLNDRIDCLRQLVALDDQNPLTWFHIGDCYFEMAEDYKAIPEFEKALELFQKFGTKPYRGAFYYELGICYHRTGQYKKEKKLYRKADRDFPGDPGLMDQYAWLDFALGDSAAANLHLEELISVRKEELWSDARIANYLAWAYSMSDMPEKEEEFRRKALSLEPESPVRMNALAYFLIDKDRNIDEGLDLADKALAITPDDYACLHTKGWGFYKKGKYNEALALLEKSWDLKPKYFHKIYLHLEEARMAAAGQNL